MPARVATTAISFAESGPPSSHTTALAINAAATNQIDTRASPVAASASPTPNAATATSRSGLDKDDLAAERDGSVRDGRGKGAVVGHDERCS